MHMQKLLLLSAIALVALAGAASNAIAYTAEVDPAGSISAESNGKLTFGSSPTLQCNFTLNGTLASSVGLRVSAHIGEITEVRISNCDGGSVSGVLNLPWKMLIISILGTAPNEVVGLSFDILGTEVNLSFFGGFVNCLYGGVSYAHTAWVDTGFNTYASGPIFMQDEPFSELAFIRGSGFCPREGKFDGELDISPTQTIVVS